MHKARNFLSVDLQDFFQIEGRGDKEKSLKMTIWLVIFRIFVIFFLISPRKVNLQFVLNLKIFHNFPKNLDRTITFNSVTLKKNNRQNLNFFFNETNNI